MLIDMEWSDEGGEGSAAFPFFHTDVEVLVSGEVEVAYAERCAKVLDGLNLSQNSQLRLMLDLMSATWRYWRSRRRTLFPGPMLQPHEVLKTVHPTGLVIMPPSGTGYAFSIEFNCDWAKEHGMGWCIRNDEAIYVGPYQDNDPWADIDDFDMNYVRLGLPSK